MTTNQTNAVRIFNPLTLATLGLKGDFHVKGDYKSGRPNTIISESNGNIYFRTYLNLPNVDVGNKSVKLELKDMGILLNELKEIARNPEPERYTILVKTWFKNNVRLQTPETACAITVGKDGEGQCYLSLQYGQKSAPLVHRFLPGELSEHVNSRGEKIPMDIISCDAAIEWADRMREMLYISVMYLNKEQPKRRGDNDNSSSSQNASATPADWDIPF